MNKTNLILFIFIGIIVHLCAIYFATKKGNPIILFDLSYRQFQDVFVNQNYYDYLLPSYKKICKENGSTIISPLSYSNYDDEEP